MPEFKYSNVQKEMEVYGYDSVIKSHCRGCHGGCGVNVYIKDGKVAKVQGDPDCHINHGTLCSKGLAAAEIAYHPDRLTYPIRRTGAKGSGQWERISWNDALGVISERILHYKEKYGSESIVMGHGTGRENNVVVPRFANLLGSPNILSPGHFCYGPRLATGIITCGSIPVADYENAPKCIMVWGNNLVISNPDEYKGENFSVALEGGAKLIVVDPRQTRIAARADLWLQLRPGTDAALGMAMAYVIVNEGLYDTEFVDNHCYGWDQWVERINQYPPEKTEKICWVPANKIREAARLFATTKPGCIQWGCAIEQQVTAADNNLILMHLMGITGNIDAPGGQVLFKPPQVNSVSKFGVHQMLDPKQAAKRLEKQRFRLSGKFVQITPKAVWDAILEEKPFVIKMLFFMASNPVLSRANSKEIYRALQKVEFMAVADFFLTPTAELADIVLPAATWLEMDYLGDYWKRHGWLLARRKAVHVGECRSDFEILNDLAHRVGQGAFWWDDFEGGLDYILQPMGLTWKEFKESRDRVKVPLEYYKYREKGFSTPTKKFELYSTAMEKLGYDPLPQYREMPEGPQNQDLYKEFPYILITGHRSPGFFITENRQISCLRELHADPEIEIHPDTAAKEGIENGDWVVIESPRGKVRQRAKLTYGIDPRVVAAQHGWWFPEKNGPDRGWQDSNINILISNDYDNCDPAVGATHIRTLLCKIYPENGRRVS